MNHSTLFRASAALFPPPHSTSSTRSHSLSFSLSLSTCFQLGNSSNTKRAVNFEASSASFCSDSHMGILLSAFTGLMLPTTLPLTVGMWISRSRRGREKSCRFFGTVRFEFLLDSSGCFLDPTVVENLPSWRYTKIYHTKTAFSLLGCFAFSVFWIC